MIFNKYIDKYIDLVENNKVITNEDIKKAIKLVKKKLSQPNVIIKSEMIDKAIEKIEEYFQYKLLPWEQFIIGLIHCYYDDETLVWDTFLFYMGRGGGKNGFISAVSWYLTTGFHGIKEYNVDIVANSENQAKTSFEDVYNVIDNNKKLSKAFYYTKEKIVYKKTKSYIKYNTSNARTKDGLRPACVIFDEIHEYENYNNIKVFRSALGKKKHCRTFMITTDGYIRGGVLDDYKEMSHSILEGENNTSRMLPLLYHLESKEEVDDKELWEKANPSLRYFKNLKVVMDQEYEDMKFQPQLYTEFMTKRMNIPEGNKDIEVTSWENILATNQEIPDLKGCTCLVGIDYMKTTDFLCAGLLFKWKGKYVWISHSWISESCNDLSRIKAPLQEWEKQGLLTFVEGVEIPPDVPALWLAQKAQEYNLSTLWMDNYRYTLLAKALRDVGFDTDKKGANNIRLARPSNEMLIAPIITSAFANHNIIWGDNPLMRWYANNTCMITSQAGNITYGKIEPKSRKTDGFKAFVAAMCGSVDLVDSGERVEYEDFGVYTY
ncbi:terminase large subunit domain-containing protein [Clostridium botulinum]|uniref:terminase large subunit domain-containing protein n=1 Tax=Clostridium botulinum TaxID=1491 RepID=UPI00059791E5|nr:terminase large subunit [Clostridium botulinum]KIL06867.1 terminase [Clostridium botulinum]MBY6932072.1 terminase large subunit [Clostridium botulinum]MBY6935348.1 terminase large subunit [Clostridium botulinum]NFG21385.1 terminase large subunit [Clostridium botulinum]NFL84347.1 terminase large subunit [Clostridium botulinum]